MFRLGKLMGAKGPGVIFLIPMVDKMVRMDLRGHGASGKPRDAKAYGLEMINDVLRLLDHLRYDAGYGVGCRRVRFT